MKPSEAELLETAALLAAGALDDAAATVARWRIDSAGDLVRDEAAALLETSSLLAESAPPVEPGAGLKARLLGRIDETPQRPAALLLDDEGVQISRTDEISWQPHPIPGIAVKSLHVDRESGRMTSLVRLDPGVEYPAHFHAAEEELLLLSGDLHIQGCSMGPGDYCRAEAGSNHGRGRTKLGAVVLIRNSAGDRIL